MLHHRQTATTRQIRWKRCAPSSSAPRNRSTAFEGLILAAILTTVAVAAGWASFTHVHDWTMRHTPAGTPDAFGWVNAVISELVPVAALLTIKRRRRAGAPIGYPLFLLIAAGTLSLSAKRCCALGKCCRDMPSATSIAHIRRVLRTLLSQAITEGHRTTNPPRT